MEFYELLRKGFWTLFVRCLGAGLMFLMSLLFARWLGADDYGVWSLCFTILTLTALLARWGSEQALVKNVGINWLNNRKNSVSYFYNTLFLNSLMSFGFTLLLLSLSDVLSLFFFQNYKYSNSIFYMSLLIFPLTLNHVISEFFKAIGQPIKNTILQSVVRPMLALCFCIITLNLFFLNLREVIFAFGLATIASCLISFTCVNRIVRGELKFDSFSKKTVCQVFREGTPFIIASTGGLIMAWGDMLVLGALGSNSDIGIYSACSQLAMLLLLILNTANSITGPKFAKMYFDNELKSMKDLACSSSTLLTVVSFFPLLFLLIFPSQILSIFGNEFSEGKMVLIILSLSQFINVSFGSVGNILAMTGLENILSRIMILAGILNIGLNVILVSYLGILGVAIASAIATVFWNVACLFIIKWKHNFIAIGGNFND